MIDDAVEAYYSYGNENLTAKLDFIIDGNKIVLKYPDMSYSDPFVKLLVRYDNVYTRVYLDFK